MLLLAVKQHSKTWCLSCRWSKDSHEPWEIKTQCCKLSAGETSESLSTAEKGKVSKFENVQYIVSKRQNSPGVYAVFCRKTYSIKSMQLLVRKFCLYLRWSRTCRAEGHSCTGAELKFNQKLCLCFWLLWHKYSWLSVFRARILFIHAPSLLYMFWHLQYFSFSFEGFCFDSCLCFVPKGHHM